MIFWGVLPWMGFLVDNVLAIDLIHVALVILFLLLCRKYLNKNIPIDKKDVVYIAIILAIFISSAFYLAMEKKICLNSPFQQGWVPLKIAKIMAKTGKYYMSEFSLSHLDNESECMFYIFPQRLDAVPFIYFLVVSFIGTNTYINLWANFISSMFFIILVYILMKFVTKKHEIGLMASIAFIASPVYLMGVFYNEIAISSFFIVLSIFFILLSLKINKLHFYILTFLIISFTAKVRPENSILFAIFFISVLIFNRSFLRHRTFWKNISVSLILALLLGIIFITHILFMPKFWGLEFMGPEYKWKYPFAFENFSENLKEDSLYLVQQNGIVIMIFLVFGIYYGFIKHRKVLLLFLSSMMPYAIVYLLYAHGSERYTYHLNLFIIPIAGMGIYFAYKLISEHFHFRNKTVFAAIFSLIVFLLIFLPFAVQKNSCELGTIEFLGGLDELATRFKSNDIIVTGRDDFAHIFNYLTDSCVIYVAFTTDGFVIKEYEKADWEKIKSFIEGNEKITYYIMPKREATENYKYYEGMYRKISSIFDLKPVFENKVASVYRIITR